MVGQNSQPMYVRWAAACAHVVGLSPPVGGSPPTLMPPRLGPEPERLLLPPVP